MKSIVVLGSTGSIGENTLDVVRKNPDKIKVLGLSTKTNIGLLQKQIDEFNPEIVSVWDEEKAELLSRKSGRKVKVFTGMDGLLNVVKTNADLVVSALVGAVGLKPAFEAIKNKKDIALANKEALVMAGDLLTKEAKKRKVSIIPIDSEHSALMQCLWKRKPEEIKKCILTASGGPFYNRPDTDLKNITPSEALAHPTWHMGPKVTIDSATLMNKGFEVIEASFLFGIPVDKIEVLVHPESIVHSMVEFIDGSVIALMHMPDMHIPIQYALSWPERWDGNCGVLDLAKAGRLNFIKPDIKRFPALKLAYEAGRTGGTVPCVLSAADEVYVEKFLSGQVAFTDIVAGIEEIMKQHKVIEKPGLDDIFSADNWARQKIEELERCF